MRPAPAPPAMRVIITYYNTRICPADQTQGPALFHGSRIRRRPAGKWQMGADSATSAWAT